MKENEGGKESYKRRQDTAWDREALKERGGS